MSSMCCLPVKNGWHFAQTSTCSSGLVEPVVNLLPQAHCTLACMYFGWIFSFMVVCSCPLNSRDDGNLPAVVARRSVLNFARDEREQGVVLADTDVLPGEHLGTALADEH